ncbi:hypothetical protein NDU88_001157 [Pleurodeles waltl]|uniref:Uncharacterized protein n=1 Tax=Pleurodeles waltl TaxID=8319 RepID=A0AAV7N9Z9_PLEWA|nr:hypothetical protein NDU88_001157 [Pleurodeles waltl]
MISHLSDASSEAERSVTFHWRFQRVAFQSRAPYIVSPSAATRASVEHGLDVTHPFERSVLALDERLPGNGTSRKPKPLLLAFPRGRRRQFQK